MRLQELFLVETTEEDRALISLSSSVYSYIKKYAGKRLKDGEIVDVGTIGQLFNTPINILDPVRIQLWSHNDILKQFPRQASSADIEDPELEGEDDRNILGFWDPKEELVALNVDYLESHGLKGAVTHELRHALDDYKSEFRAGSSTRYGTPRKKEHRKDLSNDPYASDLEKKKPYHAKPAEINARFAEVLHGVTAQIQHILKRSPENVRPRVMAVFKKLLDMKHIAHLFPEKEQSRDYKRLVKRGIDFIEKELVYVQSQQK